MRRRSRRGRAVSDLTVGSPERAAILVLGIGLRPIDLRRPPLVDEYQQCVEEALKVTGQLTAPTPSRPSSSKFAPAALNTAK